MSALTYASCASLFPQFLLQDSVHSSLLTVFLHLGNSGEMSAKSALIIGATGATGKHLLKELLASNDFSRVGEYGRRVTPTEQLGGANSKLEQKVIDFEKIEEAGLKDGRWDVLFITYVVRFKSAWCLLNTVANRLGTTRAAAGSAAAFERIDRECVRALSLCSLGHTHRLPDTWSTLPARQRQMTLRTLSVLCTCL